MTEKSQRILVKIFLLLVQGNSTPSDGLSEMSQSEASLATIMSSNSCGMNVWGTRCGCKRMIDWSKSQVSKYDLLFGLHLCERILKITDNLSKTIQNETMSASEAQNTAQQSVLTLKAMRNETMFNLFYQHVDCLCQHIDTEERKIKAPRLFEVEEREGYHSPTVEDYYSKLYSKSLDSAVSFTLEHFDLPGYAMYQNLDVATKGSEWKGLFIIFASCH